MRFFQLGTEQSHCDILGHWASEKDEHRKLQHLFEVEKEEMTQGEGMICYF